MIKRGVSNSTLIETYLTKYSPKEAQKYLAKEGIEIDIQELTERKKYRDYEE